MNDPVPLDTIVFFVDDTADEGVPMYYKGRCERAREGVVGSSVRLRPYSLGKGTHIMTVPEHRVDFGDLPPIGLNNATD